MKPLLQALKVSLLECDKGQKRELVSKFCKIVSDKGIMAIADYPVALVHDKKALEELKSLEQLQAVKDESKVRKVDVMLVSGDASQLTFTAKRPNDFWKRLSSVDVVQAMVSFLCVSAQECSDTFIDESIKKSDKGQWSVETQLRDAMRANKENKDLGRKPFIIIMCKELVNEPVDHTQALLKHYFHDNVEVITSKDKKLNYYIAFNEHMGDIGMRYFYRFDLK